MPRRGVSAKCPSSLAASKNQAGQGTMILPSTTTAPDLSRCTTTISPDSRLVDAMAWMLPTCVTSMVSWLGGIFLISSTLFFKAAFLAIGDIDEVENGVLA